MGFGRRPRSVAAVFYVLCLLAALPGLTACAWLDAKQRQLIYRPSASQNADTSLLRAGDSHFFLAVPHQAEPQRIELWWLPNADPAAPALLYLHGTLRPMQGNWHKMMALREAGFSVLAVDYRGWGQSTPITPSEPSIMQDAAIAFSELQRRAPQARQRVIYGHSMGSGVAVGLASQLASEDFGALILESAFTSFADVAQAAGFWAGLLARFNDERFASGEKIGRIHAPLLMLHGNLDTTIPARLGKQLFAHANPPKHWLLLEGGGHSDLQQVAPQQYQAALVAFRQRYLSGER